MGNEVSIETIFNVRVHTPYQDERAAKWDKRWLDILKNEVTNWSKDPSTQVAACAIGLDNIPLTFGYNGFPRGVNDSLDRLVNRELKYKYIEHAERNIINNAARRGISLEKSTLYIYPLCVCNDCAKGIIQAGIRQVIIGIPNELIPARWFDSQLIAQQMFIEANVQYSCYVYSTDRWYLPKLN